MQGDHGHLSVLAVGVGEHPVASVKDPVVRSVPLLHDLQPTVDLAARHHRLVQKLRDAGLGALADLGFIGLDTDADDPVVITGRKAARNKPLTPVDKQVNQLISAERAPVEHGFADLKSWHILTELRMDAAQATTLLRALLVLTNSQITR